MPRQKEREPKVLTEDVQAVVRRAINPGEEDDGESVTLIATKAETSTRTVYRVLAQATPTINIDLADRLCLAAGGHLSECRLYWGKWPDGETTEYF